QLKFIEHDSKDKGSNRDKLSRASFAGGFDVLFVNGHTDSMVLPVIRYKEKTIVYMADLLPSQGHIPIPYVMAYDMFPLTTLHEKKLFLKEALENNYILFFEHDPRTECCNLEETERGTRQKDMFRLAEI